jgi:nucleoid-associated protein YgaU
LKKRLCSAALTGIDMKKFSTAACLLSLACLSSSLPASAREPGEELVDTMKCEFRANAPDQHVVVRGDTLWGISGVFLEHPWCWPQVWGLNREEIHNPHWIYPGQIVYFDRSAGKLRLGTPAGSGAGEVVTPDNTVKRLVQPRIEGLGREAIPSIPSSEIEPFLSQPLIVEEKELNNTPRIVATQEGRVNLAKGDMAYVRGDLKGGTSFQVFHPGQPLKDPQTGKVIAYEAVYLGTIKLQRAAKAADEAHSFSVVNAKQEMGVGDRLLPLPPTPIINYVPHAPERPVEAHIVSVYGGVTQAGQNQIVSINRGQADGLDIGTVLELYRYGGVIADRTDGNRKVRLPDERYGSLFIFRVFNHISYGLVMEVTNTVQVNDTAKSPE